jgi:hypothetical protein
VQHPAHVSTVHQARSYPLATTYLGHVTPAKTPGNCISPAPIPSIIQLVAPQLGPYPCETDSHPRRLRSIGNAFGLGDGFSLGMGPGAEFFLPRLGLGAGGDACVRSPPSLPSNEAWPAPGLGPPLVLALYRGDCRGMHVRGPCIDVCE